MRPGELIVVHFPQHIFKLGHGRLRSGRVIMLAGSASDDHGGGQDCGDEEFDVAAFHKMSPSLVVPQLPTDGESADARKASADEADGGSP